MKARASVSSKEAEAWVKYRVHRMKVSLEEYQSSDWALRKTSFSFS
jgi:hypothetical protein